MYTLYSRNKRKFALEFVFYKSNRTPHNITTCKMHMLYSIYLYRLLLPTTKNSFNEVLVSYDYNQIGKVR